jgi:predicted glycoside hydrolase/deacetylase ChbG (UPF0249 family)
MTRTLIINADDYGLSPSVSRGILEAHLEGVLTSTTVMMTTRYVAESLRWAKAQAPKLGLGLHIVLASHHERPLLPAHRVPSLVKEDGYLYDNPVWQDQAFNPVEIEMEFTAQLEAFIQQVGRKPTHLDSHYHAAFTYPTAYAILCQLARQYQLPMRFPDVGNVLPPDIPQPKTFLSIDEDTTLNDLCEMLRQLPDGVTELMCHPGYVDDELREADVWTARRIPEIGLLKHPQVKATIEEEGIVLATFEVLSQ